MFSVLIPTKNEEQDLPGCLQSVGCSDDIHVFDSGSSDGTEAIARSAGASFTTLRNDGSKTIFGGDEAAHKNWAMKNIPFKYPWVLHLDADERATPELLKAILRALPRAEHIAAYRIRRRDFFMKRWIKHVQPTCYYLRLFRPDKMTFERVINPVSVPNGPVGDIEGYIDHYPFSKGISHWLERHNSYSTLEARQIRSNREAGKSFSIVSSLCATSQTERRFHQKELFYRFPARPLLKFMLLYVGKRGFLDGLPGFTYATLQSFYEYMIVLKTREALVQPFPSQKDSWTGLK